MEVIVQLEPEATGILNHGSASNPDFEQLHRAVASLGVTLRPQHPGIRDLGLSRYFVVDVRDRDEGERVVAALTSLRIVSAAYVKPQAELP